MRVVFLIGLVACGPGLKRADTRELGRRALLDASGDAAAIAKLLHGSVTSGGLWFDNPACAQFRIAGEIGADRLAAFARCLAGLPLRPSAREDTLGDVVVMTYAPGFEIEARVVREHSGPHLTWIGYESRRNDADNLPTITVEALESLRLTGDRNGPLDPSIASGLELDPTPKSHAAFTWIKLCLDATGSVTAAHPHETTSTKASSAFVAAATAWTFRPFTIRGQALPVCSMIRLAYPPGKAPPVETLPLPPPPSRGNRPPIVFAEGALRKFTEGKRIRGNRAITPDMPTKIAIRDARIRHVIGSFRICIDELGHVESVLPTRSTGFADYDRTLIAGIASWVYSPYLVDDQPVPVCTGVTFIYKQ